MGEVLYLKAFRNTLEHAQLTQVMAKIKACTMASWQQAYSGRMRLQVINSTANCFLAYVLVAGI